MHWTLFITVSLAAFAVIEAGKSVIPKKLKPNKDAVPIHMPDYEGNTTGGGANEFRGSFSGGSVTTECNCENVIWSTGLVEGGNHEVTQEVQSWWGGGSTCLMDAGVICSDGTQHLKDVMYIQVKYKIGYRKKTIWFKVYSTETYLMWAQSTKGYKKFGKWQKIELTTVDQYLMHTIVHWQTSKGEALWGMVNSQGMVVTFGQPDDFTYFLNRIFIQYLVKTYVVDKGFTVYKLKIKWEKKWTLLEIPAAPEFWLLATWLPIRQRTILWKVVTYIDGGIRVIYIGPNPHEGIMKIIVITRKKKFVFKVKIDQYLIYWSQKISSKYTEWKGELLGQLSKKLGLAIIHWKHYRGKDGKVREYWGLVNTKGVIVAYGEQGGGVYETTINRVFLLYLMKEYVISKGYHVKGYIIHWEGREIYRFRETIHIETLLIPDWLPSVNRGSIWMVVKHMTKIVIVYVGKEVTGPKIKSCGDDDDPYDDSEEDDNPEEYEEECKYGGVILVPEIGPGDRYPWCKTLNPFGKCIDQVNPDGYCGCRNTCSCINPFKLFQQRAKVSQSPGAIIVKQGGAHVGGHVSHAQEVLSTKYRASGGKLSKDENKKKPTKKRSKKPKKKRSKKPKKKKSKKRSKKGSKKG